MNFIFVPHYYFMALPFFYSDTITITTTTFILNEETSKHVVQVLRMQIGQALQLTNGKGYLFDATITDNNRKQCTVSITAVKFIAAENTTTIAISLLKNTNRFEWFVEKATEFGIQQIIPLLCDRTEKTAFKNERIQSIAVSAMLQSQQTWLPIITTPQKIKKIIELQQYTNKYIAHCLEETAKIQLPKAAAATENYTSNTTIILIGPEGDFTVPEIELALHHQYQAVALGNTRLRTETAGIAAAVMLTQHSV
jgi:16S rRNA (uracil1498-N3)-methyltransferase